MATITIYPTGMAGNSGIRRVDTITMVTGANADGKIITIVDTKGIVKVFELDTNASVMSPNIAIGVLVGDTAPQIATKVRNAISAQSELYVLASVGTGVNVDKVIVTQRKPSALIGSTATNGLTVTVTTIGVDPTGDAAILQNAIDSACDADVIIMKSVDINNTPTAWKIAGEFVEDFDVYTARNGVNLDIGLSIGSAGQVSLFRQLAAAGRNALRGRCIEINKEITIIGDGVDVNNVPLTKINTEDTFDYAGWLTAVGALIPQILVSGDPSAPTFFWRPGFTVMAANPAARMHVFVLHNKKVRLQNLHFDHCECVMSIHHPFELIGIHWTEVGPYLPLQTRLDTRSVYPNYSVSNIDFSNAIRSSINNCVIYGGHRGLSVQGAMAIDVMNCKIVSDYGNCLHVTSGRASQFALPNNNRDYIYARDAIFANNNLESRNCHQAGAAITLIGGGDGPINGNFCEENLILNNQITVSSPYAKGAGILDVNVLSGVCRKNQFIANTITKCARPIRLANQTVNGFIEGEIFAENIFINSRFVDTEHLANPFPEIICQNIVNGGSVNSLLFSKNDYTNCGAPGIINGGGTSGGVMLLIGVYNSVIHDNGGYPPGQEGAKNHVTDLLGFNNRIVGDRANILESPVGIGDVISSLQKNIALSMEENSLTEMNMEIPPE